MSFPGLENRERSIGLATGIESARKTEDAIVIISAAECEAGLQALRTHFGLLFPGPADVSVVPILRSGLRLGEELSKDLNPMRMSYYKDDTSRLPEPICLQPPDIFQIVTPDGRTKPVAFTETVVESQGTILAAMRLINGMIDELNEGGGKFSYPDYHCFTYVSKTGNKSVAIPNLVPAFRVHPDIWVGGRGCDLPGDKARGLDTIVGILSPFAESIPQQPYFTRAFDGVR